MKYKILTGLILVSLFLSACSQGLERENEDLKKQVFDLQQEVEDLKNENQKLEMKIIDLGWEEVPVVEMEIKNQLYENDLMSMEILDGWKVEEVENSLNIRNGNYILYINPKTTQASGVIGGRFSEIAMGAPGADLILKTHPAEPCGDEENSVISEKLIEKDYYVSNEVISGVDNCNRPFEGDPVWYFSYISTKDGYFGDLSQFTTNASEFDKFIITMTYDADTVDELPAKNSPELREKLAEMSSMVRSLNFKEFIF